DDRRRARDGDEADLQVLLLGGPDLLLRERPGGAHREGGGERRGRRRRADPRDELTPPYLTTEHRELDGPLHPFVVPHKRLPSRAESGEAPGPTEGTSRVAGAHGQRRTPPTASSLASRRGEQG